MAFSPSGVRCPSRAQTADPSQGRAQAAGEPYAEEALAFTRTHCLQRDVEVEVSPCRSSARSHIVKAQQEPSKKILLPRSPMLRRLGHSHVLTASNGTWRLRSVSAVQ